MPEPRVIAQRYELTGPIGHGGMGEVWSGYDRRLDRPIAVKLLRPPGTLAAPELRTVVQRFRREARVTARLEHRGVPAVYDAGADGDELYIVMQLVAGMDLADLVAERGPVSVDWTVAIAAQVCTVLAAAHEASLVHRDLKPRNIMLSTDGVVRVLDFGVAALLEPEASRLTATGETLGSPAYMAPEQALRSVVSPRSDLYALGCVTYELLAGAPVFDAGSPLALLRRHVEDPPRPLRGLRDDVPEAVDALVLALLAKDPEDRPATAVEVHAALADHLPPSGSSDAAEAWDPTLPYRRPLAPRATPSPSASPAAPPPSDIDVDVDTARERAADLVDRGRFTQAAALLSDAARAARGRSDAWEVRLELASVLLLGGQYRAALPEYETLAGHLAAQDGHEDIAVHCRYQAASCRAALGDTGTALDDYRTVLSEQRRLFGSGDPRTFEVQHQVALLLASSGDVQAARAAAEELLSEQRSHLGPGHPQIAETVELIEHLRRVKAG